MKAAESDAWTVARNAMLLMQDHGWNGEGAEHGICPMLAAWEVDEGSYMDAVDVIAAAIETLGLGLPPGTPQLHPVAHWSDHVASREDIDRLINFFVREPALA